jgi:hypothetical protein
MNITKETIKSTLRSIMAEESEYQTFFKKALEKAGKSIPSMSDEEKKEFFNKIDAAWNAKGEKNEALKGDQHKLDVDGDGDIEADDLADLRAGKKANESSDCGCGCGGVTEGGCGDTKVTEGVSPKDMESIKGAVQSASSFMNIGSELKKLGMKYIFATSPMPIYVVQDKSGNRVGIVNKKYATKPDFVHGDTAVGVMESLTEGRAFINAAKKAKAEGKTEFEFNGKTYPVTIKESVNEIQYKDAVAKFNDELINHPMVKKAAQHYKKTPAEIVKVLQQRLSTKGNRGGDTKEVSIDFKDTDSGINIKHKKSFNESVNEGKRRFNTNYGVGKSKYVVNYHDGVKKHKDGSDFFDVKIFKNQKDLEAFKKALLQKGFVAESVVNEDANMNKKVKAFLDKGLRDLTKGKPNHQFAVMHVLMGALTDANFHSEAKKVPSIFTRAKYEGDPRGEKDVIGIYEEMGENVASICKWDGKDIVDAIGFYVSMTIGRPVGEKVEKLVESINETIYLLNNKK